MRCYSEFSQIMTSPSTINILLMMKSLRTWGALIVVVRAGLTGNSGMHLKLHSSAFPSRNSLVFPSDMDRSLLVPVNFCDLASVLTVFAELYGSVRYWLLKKNSCTSLQHRSDDNGELCDYNLRMEQDNLTVGSQWPHVSTLATVFFILRIV